MYLAGSNMTDINRHLQKAIDSVSIWTKMNGFHFSVGKTKAISFHNKRKHKERYKPTLSLYGSSIEVKEEIKFLGMIFDSKMTWIPHFKEMKKRVAPAINLLRTLAHLRWGSDRKTLSNLYQSLILTKLDYRCHIYGSA